MERSFKHKWWENMCVRCNYLIIIKNIPYNSFNELEKSSVSWPKGPKLNCYIVKELHMLDGSWQLISVKTKFCLSQILAASRWPSWLYEPATISAWNVLFHKMTAKGKRPISTQRPYATRDMCCQNYYPALYVFEWPSMNVLNLENAQACAVDINTIPTNKYLFTIIIHSLIYKFTGMCCFYCLQFNKICNNSDNWTYKFIT